MRFGLGELFLAGGALSIGLFAFGQPFRKFFGRFQGDGTQRTRAQVVNHNLCRLGGVDASAGQQGAAHTTHGVEHLLVAQAFQAGQFVAGHQLLRVMRHQVGQQLQCHFFVVKSVDANGTTGGQVVAALQHDDARPQHAGRIVQIEVVSNGDALLGFGHARNIAGFSCGFAFEGVDQG